MEAKGRPTMEEESTMEESTQEEEQEPGEPIQVTLSIPPDAAVAAVTAAIHFRAWFQAHAEMASTINHLDHLYRMILEQPQLPDASRARLRDMRDEVNGRKMQRWERAVKLVHLHDLIDYGRTAKLRQWQSILHLYVKKEQGQYLIHKEGYKNPRGMIIVHPKTTFYQTWDDLINEIGYDAKVNGWEITDEPLREYYPPVHEPEPPDADMSNGEDTTS